MKDINKMRLGVIRELKHVRYFFDEMEKGAKSRDSNKILRAYIFLKQMVWHMQEGDLTPEALELHEALLIDYQKQKT